MSYLFLRRVFLFIFLILFILPDGNAQFSKKSNSKNPEKGLFGKTSRSSKTVKIKEPGAAHKARKKQEKNEKQLKQDYAKSVERSKKRTYDIQSPEVQARMKQNEKDLALRNKEKKKNLKASSKKAGKKYN
ncbi:MAG: hypothetical protein IPN67_03790 [Bacteroidales bacterium]|nr:hypothetical protein [Bacteroidales bacterium]MBK8881516.1 hypothetical protein [Bacteroidales bacterium]